jgi:zinc transport system ATP-binding protein
MNEANQQKLYPKTPNQTVEPIMEKDDPILRVTNLSVKLQNQIILDSINFTVNRGTILAIVGPNGAGKTILFKALLNLIPHEGKIEWKEKVRIGYVPQNISVDDIPISVSEFISFRNGEDAQKYLDPVKLGDKATLEKSLGILSGGQLRRVLIAWALVDKPNVLLFDEPTTGVDIDSEEPIYRMLNELREQNKITILLITHDIHIIREYSDQLLALNKCVTFFGESKKIMDIEVQKKIYGEPVCVGTETERVSTHE